MATSLQKSDILEWGLKQKAQKQNMLLENHKSKNNFVSIVSNPQDGFG